MSEHPIVTLIVGGLAYLTGAVFLIAALIFAGGWVWLKIKKR